MAKNYRGDGIRTKIPANVIAAAVTAGDLVLVNETHMVVLRDGAANAANVGARTGVWELAKDTSAGSAGAIGDKAYADGSQNVTGVATSNVEIGTFEAAAADAAATALIRLKGTDD